VLLLAFLFASPAPVLAQTITVQNGGTVTVENDGVWDLKGTTVDLGGTGSTASINETGGGRFANGQLTATRALNAPSARDVAGLGVEISASVDLGNVDVTRGHAVQTGNGNPSIERYYDFSPSQNNSGLNAKLTFTYNDAELNGRTESELEFFKSDDGGASWSEEGFDSRDATANTVTLSGIKSLSRWTLGSESAPLPVELAGFDGTVSDRGVDLTWQTTEETNNAGFEIQRKRTDVSGEASWKKIGFVDGTGTTSESRTYEFTDADLPYAADSLRYRLRQVDVDGTGSVSEPILVGRTVDELELLGTYPNPARSRATVRFAVPERQTVTLRLYDMLGRRVRTVVNDPQEGRKQMQVSLSDLSSGIYFLRLAAGDHMRTQKLTVVR
jgi:hypothetical protein